MVQIRGGTETDTDAQQPSANQDGETPSVTSVTEQNSEQKSFAPGPGPATVPAPDYVIQKVAQRAGTDPEFNAVMKVVATGEASKDQLELFQAHINDSTPQNHTTGQKRGAAANEKVESKKRKSSDDPPSTTGEATAGEESRKVRLSTPDLEFDYDRSQLRDPRPTPGRKARPRYEEREIPQDLKAHLDLTRYVPKPEKPPGRLNRSQKDQLFVEAARMDPQDTFYSIYKCHDKGREGSPTYDSAGFELDYDKVAEWRKPRAYKKSRMVRGMERNLNQAEKEQKLMFELFFEEMPNNLDGTLHKVKDYVKDHVSKDLGIPWHQITSETVKMWRNQGFRPVKFEQWWKEPTTEENKRFRKMLSGGSLRKWI
jgi:hypothetical protein